MAMTCSVSGCDRKPHQNSKTGKCLNHMLNDQVDGRATKAWEHKKELPPPEPSAMEEPEAEDECPEKGEPHCPRCQRKVSECGAFSEKKGMCRSCCILVKREEKARTKTQEPEKKEEKKETIAMPNNDKDDKDDKDMVNHPPHYNKDKIEVADFIDDQKLDFFAGNVVKYVVRSPHKDNELEDLMKASWYLNRLIDRAKAQKGGEV